MAARASTRHGIASLHYGEGMAPHRLAVATLVALTRERPSRAGVLRHVSAYGVEAVLPVLVLGLVVGGVGVARASGVLSAVGGQQLAQDLLVLLVQDAGPLLAALLVLVRSGASLAIDAREAKAAPGMVALERIVGLQLSVLGLYVFLSIAALLGGSIGASVGLGAPLHVPGSALDLSGLVMAVVRCVSFATVIGLFSCGEGLTERPTRVVARRTTLAAGGSCLVLEACFGVLT